MIQATEGYTMARDFYTRVTRKGAQIECNVQNDPMAVSFRSARIFTATHTVNLCRAGTTIHVVQAANRNDSIEVGKRWVIDGQFFGARTPADSS